MTTISTIPKVQTTFVSPTEATSLQPQDQTSSATIAQMSLGGATNSFHVPIPQALRNVAVCNFVTKHGLNFHCDIYNEIEQEAASMAKKGLFPSAEEAEHAIWEEFESYVQTANKKDLKAAIMSLNDPFTRDAWAKDRIQGKRDELAEATHALIGTKSLVLQARRAWEKSFANLGAFLAGPKDVYPCENARTERLLRIKHKCALSTYEKTRHHQEALEKRIAALEDIDESAIQADVVAECEDCVAFLRHCNDPGKRTQLALKQQLQVLTRDLRFKEGGLDAIEAIRKEHYVKLCENNSGFQKVEDLVLANDDYPYEGAHKESVPVWVNLTRLFIHAAHELQDLQDQIREIEQTLQEQYTIIDTDSSIDTFTTSEEFIKQFLALSGSERQRMDHFLSMAMNYPRFLDVKPSEVVFQASPSEQRLTVVLSLAAKKLENLNMQVSQNKLRAKDLVASLLDDYRNRKEDGAVENEAHNFAVQTLLHTIMAMKGLLNKNGVPLSRDGIEESQILDGSEEPVVEALKRLSMNNLMLFKDEADKDALVKCAKTLHQAEQSNTLSRDVLNDALTNLKTESEDAHNLVEGVLHWKVSRLFGDENSDKFFSSQGYMFVCLAIISSLSLSACPDVQYSLTRPRFLIQKSYNYEGDITLISTEDEGVVGVGVIDEGEDSESEDDYF